MSFTNAKGRADNAAPVGIWQSDDNKSTDSTVSITEQACRPSAKERARIRAQAIAGMELLAELFPGAISIYEPRRRPLKVGISADIAAKLDGAITPDELTVILRRYTSSVFYLGGIKFEVHHH